MPVEVYQCLETEHEARILECRKETVLGDYKWCAGWDPEGSKSLPGKAKDI